MRAPASFTADLRAISDALVLRFVPFRVSLRTPIREMSFAGHRLPGSPVLVDGEPIREARWMIFEKTQRGLEHVLTCETQIHKWPCRANGPCSCPVEPIALDRRVLDALYEARRFADESVEQADRRIGEEQGLYEERIRAEEDSLRREEIAENESLWAHAKEEAAAGRLGGDISTRSGKSFSGAGNAYRGLPGEVPLTNEEIGLVVDPRLR